MSQINRDYLLRQIGREVGWGRNPSDWSENQSQDAQDIIDKALRQFYSPPILPNERTQHEWSFLTPLHILTTKADVHTYDLPEDFAGTNDELTYKSASQGFRSVRLVTDIEIRRLRQGVTDISGYPDMAAIVPLPADGDEPQRWQLLLYPTPSGVYEFDIRYRSDPTLLSASKPYPPGGPVVGDALVASAIAAAHAYVNDDTTGMHYAFFIERLRAAVAFDRQRNIHSLGYYGEQYEPTRREHDTRLIYNGVEL